MRINIQKLIALISWLLSLNTLVGQTLSAKYNVLTKKADSLFEAKKYYESSATYSQAFKTLGWKGRQEDRYKAACSWALAGFQDSAIFNLERITLKLGFADYERVISDTSLKSLYNNSRWGPLIQKIKDNRDFILAGEEKWDKELVAKLDSMAQEDQKWRRASTFGKVIKNEIPKDSVKWPDVSNYPILKKIFTSYGFPNYDLVGVKGSHNFWLLVQHQDLHPSFQDSVLAAMKIQAENGKASWKDYAYLIDRVKCNTGQLQIYGTQVNWISGKSTSEPKPVMEPDKLNERRKSVGLDTEEEYLRFMEAHLSD